MGLFDKAKEAAEQAAERARGAAEQASSRASGATDRTSLRAAADQARAAAGQLGKATSDAMGNAATAVADPTNQAHARDAASRGFKRAKSGVASMIDRIDPGLLADIVIKATSLQEKANRRLREKHSPYRINEITITAGLPPDVAFTIGRIEVEEEDIPRLTEEADEQADLAAEQPGAVLDATGLGFVEPGDDDSAASDLAEASLAADEAGVPVMAADPISDAPASAPEAAATAPVSSG
jgi:hypothetical protein